jgi:hypothetical protein
MYTSYTAFFLPFTLSRSIVTLYLQPKLLSIKIEGFLNKAKFCRLSCPEMKVTAKTGAFERNRNGRPGSVIDSGFSSRIVISGF